MSEIFTRDALNRIMEDGNLTPRERVEQVYGLYGRALEGYVEKATARQVREAAMDAAVSRARAKWEQEQAMPNVVDSDEYRALKGEFDAYRAMQGARMSADYAEVKPKFFETVYGMVDRKDGAKPVAEQLADIRKGYEEYFEPEKSQQKPTFGAPVEGSMPKGETGAVKGFADAWGFVPKKT